MPGAFHYCGVAAAVFAQQIAGEAVEETSAPPIKLYGSGRQPAEVVIFKALIVQGCAIVDAEEIAGLRCMYTYGS